MNVGPMFIRDYRVVTLGFPWYDHTFGKLSADAGVFIEMKYSRPLDLSVILKCQSPICLDFILAIVGT